MRNFRNKVGKLLLFAILFSTAFVFSGDLKAQTVLNNGLLRFGTGAENSVNASGNLQQPFYFNGSLWRKLTYSSYPLDMAFGVGGDGTNEWNFNGTYSENPTIAGQVIDLTGYTVTTSPNGYGIIISTGTVTVNGQTFQVENKYELKDAKSYVKVTMKITNSSGSTLSNLRYWVGTRDDYVGGSDVNMKTKGNLVDGAFVQIPNAADRSLALKITSAAEGILFYTGSPRGNTSVDSCCSFTNITNQDPTTSPIVITNDGSYGFFVRFDDLAINTTTEFVWYYAAGPIAQLDAIIADVAADIDSNTNANAAPVLDDTQSPVLSPIQVNNFNSNGNTVAEIVVNGSITDADGLLGEAIAITGVDETNGDWEYSLDGTTWLPIGALSDSNALLLSADEKIRFVPANGWTGTASFTFRAWDQSDGTVGTAVNTQGGGLTTPYSLLSDTASINVENVITNVAPALDLLLNPTLNGIAMDNVNSSGNSIAEIILPNEIIDTPVSESIAITGVDNTNGIWQYSLNGGVNWNAIAPVSSTSALLLDSNHRVRFVPNASWTGTATFTFRAWDKTEYTAGNLADSSVNGGSTSFSVDTDTALISVINTNNAPVLTIGDDAPFLSPINEDNFSSAGNTIAQIMPDGSITDPDGPVAEAIAAYDFDNANGMWQFSADGGLNWTDTGATTTANALLLDANYKLRFVPNPDWVGTPTFNARAWDKRVGTAGQRINVASYGGTTSFSGAETPIYINVKAVNDLPVIVNQVAAIDINEDSSRTIIFGDINVTDIDNAYPADFTLTVGAGSDYTVEADNVTITPNLNFVGVLTVPVTVNDGTADSNTFNLTINVNAVNDAPVFTSSPSLTANEDSSYSYTAVATDIDLPADTLTYSAPLLPGWLSFDVDTQVLSGTPTNADIGNNNVIIRVTDGTTFVDQSFTINVSNVNDAPVITGQSLAISMDEDTTKTIVFSDITVVDDDNTYPDDFSLTVLPNDHYTVDVDGRTVIAASNFIGTLYVRVQVNDGNLDSNVFEVEITVNNTNDAPVINSQNAISTNEDTSRTIVFGDLNVTDVDNTYPTGFTLTVSSGTNYTVLGNVITPSSNFNGNLTVPVIVNDGSANSNTFNLTVAVNAVNDAPVINSQNVISTNEDTSRTIIFGDLNVTDVDNTYPTGFTLTVSSGTNYTVLGNVITPSSNFNGNLTVPVTVNDGNANSNTFNLTVAVNAVNDAPIIMAQAHELITDEDVSIEIPFTVLDGIDVDNIYPDDFTLTVLAGTNYTVSGTTITPSLNFNGELTVPVYVNDGTDNSNTFNLTVIVNPVDDNISWISPLENAVYSIAEGNEEVIFTALAENLDTDTITYSIVEDYEGLFIDSVTGEVIWNPDYDQAGQYFVTVEAFDGINTISRVVTINVDFIDDDNDTIPDTIDNCPTVANTDQADNDSDLIGNACDNDDDNDGISDTNDNCLFSFNPAQQDSDLDRVGDDCDEDDDNDTITDVTDNCQFIANASQTDSDDDLIGDACDSDSGVVDRDGDSILDLVDNCIEIPNIDQKDTDEDTIGDACDSDDDNDGITDTEDNCQFVANEDQLNSDSDDAGNACDSDDDGDLVDDSEDNCKLIYNPSQQDTDLDKEGDVCDIDDDNDGVNDTADNCKYIANPSQADSDDDNIGDACDPDSGVTDRDGDSILDVNDNCVDIPNIDQINTDNDAFGDACDNDDDGDSVPDSIDNCKLISNNNQLDSDLDGIGDACDPDSGVVDSDNDTVIDSEDNCPLIPNTNQLNSDNDSFGDACDSDDDGDLIDDSADNCSLIYNPSQEDFDLDGIGNECDEDDDGDSVNDVIDNCPFIANENQLDSDDDNIGDACDPDSGVTDRDGDSILDVNDNCVNVPNIDQINTDDDEFGDACDFDDDNDGIADTDDNCKLIANADQLDSNDNGIGDACDGIVNVDSDDDGVIDSDDNCPLVPNSNQLNTDGDRFGDVCDNDDDGDEVADTEDNCQLLANADQLDSDEDGLGDICDSNFCSETQPTGQCPNGELCVEGICETECSETAVNGACPNGQLCVEGTCEAECSAENQTGACPDGSLCVEGTCEEECSSTNLTGACPNGQMCVEGVCENECSETNVNGVCPDGQLCVEGTCEEECSSANQNGACTDGSLCVAGTCEEECSTQNPNGACPDGNLCVEGICEGECSQTNQNGACPDGQYCVEGTCEDECSSTNLTGACPNGQLCSEGSCQNECSAQYKEGVCETGKECVDGTCEPIRNECSSEHLDGYCPSGQECSSTGVCVDIPDNYKDYRGSSIVCSYSTEKDYSVLILLGLMIVGLIIRRRLV